ncbi:GroES-like protein [Fusarium austroafricanum]|uniref:GroES-like protein n=1 Tax=Fusarium austroafricanum TaxID=2364996 RepID=A0A8H4K8G2_9HYPO|nr:GroES-like protein [Fusarium austroafricanum]
MELQVIAIDTDPYRLWVARLLGADHICNAKGFPRYLDGIRKFCLDGVFAAVNFTDSGEAYTNIRHLIHGGGILMVGARNGRIKDLEECLKFSADNGIEPLITLKKLEKIPAIMEKMKADRIKGRVGVQFFKPKKKKQEEEEKQKNQKRKRKGSRLRSRKKPSKSPNSTDE